VPRESQKLRTDSEQPQMYGIRTRTANNSAGFRGDLKKEVIITHHVSAVGRCQKWHLVILITLQEVCIRHSCPIRSCMSAPAFDALFSVFEDEGRADMSDTESALEEEFAREEALLMRQLEEEEEAEEEALLACEEARLTQQLEAEEIEAELAALDGAEAALEDELAMQDASSPPPKHDRLMQQRQALLMPSRKDDLLPEWRCPECGEANPGEVQVCAHCGFWKCDRCGSLNVSTRGKCRTCHQQSPTAQPEPRRLKPRRIRGVSKRLFATPTKADRPERHLSVPLLMPWLPPGVPLSNSFEPASWHALWRRRVVGPALTSLPTSQLKHERSSAQASEAAIYASVECVAAESNA
jgi:hypothetical protein